MKTSAKQAKAAKKFVENWQGHGYEKGEAQKFWIDLLTNVFGVRDIANFIFFEELVKDKIQNKTITNYIDAYIPSTKVMIENKASHKDLQELIKQSDGRMRTSFQQARDYISTLPLSKHPKWIVTCNFNEFQVYDMENPTSEPQRIFLKDLEKEYYRLQFLVDDRSEHLKRELEVSVKACELVGRIYDALLEQYVDKTSAETLHSLNVLCVRLVFCLYAEDAGLFGSKTAFHDYLAAFPANHIRRALIDLFGILNTPLEFRDPYTDPVLAHFPYVNGGLFGKTTVETHGRASLQPDIEIPNFTEEIKQLLLQKASADFDWNEISPTIFGSLFESTLNPETRRKDGMHYTSIENIHKVIDPLFMDELETEFRGIVETQCIASLRRRKLLDFQNKLASLKFLDPACGSGNFLTETYLSLRRLENKVLDILNKGEKVFGFDEEFIKVSINQFYGIEINDFAVTVAKTALWIAECQMMEETERLVGQDIDFLPLKSNANIRVGNALRMDWNTLAELPHRNLLYTEKLNIYQVDDFEDVRQAKEALAPYNGVYRELDVATKEYEFKKPESEENIEPVVYDYIMGNPPFVGYSLQSKEQKEDTLAIYVDDNGKPYKSAGKIDYVANWYFKAAQLIQNERTKCAFVSTNSITQGEQVSTVWKPLFERFGIHIDFAYRTFRWDSESEQKAHVHCVIVGFSSDKSETKPKRIFINDSETIGTSNINPYLIDAENVWIESRNKPICDVPFMTTGNRPADGGHLIIEADEYEEFITKEPSAAKFIKKLTGAEEFINNKKRWCLWLVGASPAELRKLPEVNKRVTLCKQDRLKGAPDRQKLADTPTLFRELKNPERYIIIPATSSESRKYIPIGFLDYDTIPTNSVLILPDAGLYEFGVLTSSVHMAWVKMICGRLKSDYRYSKDIVYNNFPWPMEATASSQSQQLRDAVASIEQTAQGILDTRAKYPDSTLADLYDDTFMPADLRKAHRENDKAVMQAYGFDPKLSESEIVAELFKMYRKLTEKQ